MASLSPLFIFIPLFFTFLSSSNANTFNVGGKDGWTLHPSESYNQWSSRLRFIVNDTLHFKYDGGSDSVMEVSKGDYDSCNVNNPITTLTGGDSVVNLNRPGPFYFISGKKSNCDQGQKLTVVVISPKKKQTPAAGAPSPTSLSPIPVAPVSSPPESGTPVSTTPAAAPGGGMSSPPTSGPVASPGGGVPSSRTGGPAASPGGGVSSSPIGGPAASPGGGVSSPTGGPAASPGGGVSSSPTGGPAASPGGGVSSPIGGPAASPGGGVASSPMGNPADLNGPAPGGSPESAGRALVSATLSVPLGMIVFGLLGVY